MLHAFITVVISFDTAYVNNVEAYLKTLGNPPVDNIRQLLDDGKFVHFMSMSVIRDDTGPTSQLIMEISGDGTVRSVLEPLADALRLQIETVLLYAGVRVPADESLSAFLERHHCPVGQGWADTPGLNFDGTPEMSVVQVRQEAELAKKIANMIDELPVGSAAATLERVRNLLWDEDNWKWAFMPAPTAILGEQPADYEVALQDLISAVAKILPGLLLIAAASFLILWHITNYGIGGLAMTFILIAGAALPVFTRRELAPALPVFGSALFNFLWVVILLDAIVFLLTWLPNGVNVAAEWTFRAVVAEAIAAWVLLKLFRRAEERDKPDDVEPDRRKVASFMQREGWAAQSHLAAASTVKPGWLRHFTLRIGLWLAGVLVTGFSKPGYLTQIGVIHFARWILVPGTDKLVFLSNYDGAWQSYLEDFIVRTPAGVTMIWSNTKGFPRTRSLILGGAEDGDRLKRWIRRQQYPTLFWYTAYEKLTLTRIRANTEIRNGLSQVKSDKEADAWFAKFGAARTNPPQPAPVAPLPLPKPVALDIDNISTLVFGGLKSLPYARALVLTFSDGPRGATWLAAVADDIGYGYSSNTNRTAVVGLSAGGLSKLGLTPTDLETFPVAFQEGASAPSRSPVLGDEGPHHPSQWQWGGLRNDPLDAVMLLYAVSEASLDKFAESANTLAKRLGHRINEIRLEPPRDMKSGFTEPFGFADGISQPVIRGTQKDRAQTPEHHLVAAGEFILGYPNEPGYFPPSPSIPAAADPNDLLRPASPDPNPDRARGIVPPADAPRDLGHNGTYLVVRQLEQDTKALDGFLRCAVAEVEKNFRAPKLKGQQLADWLFSRMVGRWKDGSSLVRNPGQPVGQRDNDFLFHEEHPAGGNCPFGAHVRRSNPRETLEPSSDPKLRAYELQVTKRHRILRVGRPYRAGEKEGLLFMCFNSDIERQFEFIQQNWVLGKNFHSLENETDAVIGAALEEEDSVFTIPTGNGPLRIKCRWAFMREHEIDSLVKVIGAGYFFVPGKRAFEFIASLRSGEYQPPAGGYREPAKKEQASA